MHFCQKACSLKPGDNITAILRWGAGWEDMVGTVVRVNNAYTGDFSVLLRTEAGDSLLTDVPRDSLVNLAEDFGARTGMTTEEEDLAQVGQIPEILAIPRPQKI